MELSKTVALTAVLFIVVLILTSGNSVGAGRSQEPAVKKPRDATFERSRKNQAARPAGTEYAPPKRGAGARRVEAASPSPCQFKPVMTEADMRACRRK